MLYLNEKLFRFKKISCLLSSFFQVENETPIHFFHGCIKNNLLWYKLKKIIKTKIDLYINTPQSAIFGFLNCENNSDIINHLLLIFNTIYLIQGDIINWVSKCWKRKIVKIYNVENQICLNDLKKMRKFRKKWEIIANLLQ